MHAPLRPETRLTRRSTLCGRPAHLHAAPDDGAGRPHKLDVVEWTPDRARRGSRAAVSLFVAYAPRPRLPGSPVSSPAPGTHRGNVVPLQNKTPAPVRARSLKLAVCRGFRPSERTQASPSECRILPFLPRIQTPNPESRAGRGTAPTARPSAEANASARLVWRELPAFASRLGEGRFVELRADCDASASVVARRRASAATASTLRRP